MGVPGQEGDREGGGDNPKDYMMAFQSKARSMPFPAEGCSVQEAM